MYVPSFKLISQSMLKKSPENVDGRTDRRTDGHCHGIIRPFFKRAYKNLWIAYAGDETQWRHHEQTWFSSFLLIYSSDLYKLFGHAWHLNIRHITWPNIESLKCICWWWNAMKTSWTNMVFIIFTRIQFQSVQAFWTCMTLEYQAHYLA